MSGDKAEGATPAEATPGVVYQERPCKHCGGPVVAPRRKGLVKDFCSDRHRAAHRDATIAAQIRAAETAIKDAGLAIVDIRDELERQVAILTGALAMLERCQPKRLRIA